jgi:hypothetical protein
VPGARSFGLLRAHQQRGERLKRSLEERAIGVELANGGVDGVEEGRVSRGLRTEEAAQARMHRLGLHRRQFACDTGGWLAG